MDMQTINELVLRNHIDSELRKLQDLKEREQFLLDNVEGLGKRWSVYTHKHAEIVREIKATERNINSYIERIELYE